MIKLTRNQIMICSSVVVISITAAVICYMFFSLKKNISMKLSEKGLDLLKSYESLRLTAYRDSGGVLTIGWGHTQGVKEGDTCTLAEATQFLLDDVAEAEKAINKQNLNLNQNQYDALVSFVFNVGADAFKKSTLLKELKKNPNNQDVIKREFRRWKIDNGKIVDGLINRREKEINLYFA